MKSLLAEWHGQPTLEEARRVRQALSDILEEHHVPKADSFLLAVAELIVNLTRYPEPRPSELCARFSKDDYYWNLELLDNGPSFNNFSQQIHDPQSVEAAESGMGLKLLASQFHELSYVPACYRDDNLNLMLLRQPINDVVEVQRVLVVDDDPVWRAVLNGYLSDQYQVIACSSVEEAFQQILEDKPVLVICDLQMPGHDGSVLFDWISHIPQVATTAFIYLSGSEDQKLISNAVSRPIDDFLRKPINKSELLQTLERALLRRKHLSDQIHRDVEDKITLGLHPSLPDTVGGMRCALRTVAPESGGGDLVLLRHSTLVFADLMGHGVQAKGFAFALAGYLRGLLAASATNHTDVALLLQQIAEAFNDDPVLSETLATIIALEFFDDGTLHIANAGQPQPILMRNGEVSCIPVDGPLLGLLVEQYRSQPLKLESGDRLLLFSDGFLDAGESISAELQNQLKHSASLPLSAAADYLLQVKLGRALPDDDMTIILLECP